MNTKCVQKWTWAFPQSRADGTHFVYKIVHMALSHGLAEKVGLYNHYKILYNGYIFPNIHMNKLNRRLVLLSVLYVSSAVLAVQMNVGALWASLI